MAGSNATSRDTISNDLINHLVVLLVSITDSVYELPNGNYTFVHREFMFSIVSGTVVFLAVYVAMACFVFGTPSKRDAFEIVVITPVPFLR